MKIIRILNTVDNEQMDLDGTKTNLFLDSWTIELSREHVL